MFRRERLSGESEMMADWSLTAGLAQSDSRTSSPMCRRPSGTDCREQVSIKSGRPVAKKVGSAREAAYSPRASVFVYNIFYGVLADEAGRFPVTGNYTTKKNTEGINAIEACALWRFSLSVRIQKNKCERVFRVNRMAHS